MSTTTTAAAQPAEWLRIPLPRLNDGLVATTTTAAAQRRLGGYDHGNGYDHDCCGSTTAAITTLAMVTIAAGMATIAEPTIVLDRALLPAANFINWVDLLTRGREDHEN